MGTDDKKDGFKNVQWRGEGSEGSEHKGMRGIGHGALQCSGTTQRRYRRLMVDTLVEGQPAAEHGWKLPPPIIICVVFKFCVPRRVGKIVICDNM